MLVMLAHPEIPESRPRAMLALVLFALITVVVLSLSALGSAHATLVLGTLTTQPAPRQPGTPFRLTLKLLDLTQIPVEDALVIAEFRHPASQEPVIVRLSELIAPGSYGAELTLPRRGTYRLLLRDQTYRQEEAQAELDFVVGESKVQPLEFVFPPTATGNNVWTWIVFLVGIPAAAGVVVTVLVLWRDREEKGAEL